MNASPLDQRRLLEIAALDIRARAAEDAARNPAEATRIAELREARAELTRALARARGDAEDARTELGRVDSDLKVVEARIARDSERLASSSNSKEAQSLEHELGALARRRSDLEDADIEAMERAETADAAVVQIEADLASIQSEGASLSTLAQEAIARAEAEREAALRDRSAVASTISSELLSLYERLAVRSSGAALLQRQTCEGCRMVLAGSDFSAIRAAAPDAVVMCPECGCILVRTEESGL